jgi:(4S)-4-hydroxy-5-phosphonooxypentane-2,3-dione isomerase
MHIVIVQIHVKPEKKSEFIAATIKNAECSRQELGIVRFDFLQDKDDLSKFILYEVYKHPEDQMKHRETEHYIMWKDAVSDMMAEARQGVKYSNISPNDSDWE